MSASTSSTSVSDATPKPKRAMKKVAQRPKASHPPFLEMVTEAILTMKQRGGSSRQAIMKFIVNKWRINGDNKMVNSRVKVALRKGVKNGTLLQTKGKGATGSFKVAEKKKEPKLKSVLKKTTKKPTVGRGSPKKTTKAKTKRTGPAQKSAGAKKGTPAKAKKAATTKKSKAAPKSKAKSVKTAAKTTRKPIGKVSRKVGGGRKSRD